MDRQYIRSVVIAASLGAGSLMCACGGVDRDVAHLVTIEQGVFGQRTYVNDTWPLTAHKYDSNPLDVYEAPRGQSAPIAQVTSGEMGFYEVALSPGDYEICVNGDDCHGFTVHSNERVRLDYQAGELRWHVPSNP